MSRTGDLNYVKNKAMFDAPFVPSVINKAQEQLLISQAESNAKVINQLDDLNKLYTTASYAKMAKNIEAPTLIIWGQNDQIVNVEVAQELKTMLKRADAPVILNRVGHVPILEAPERVIQNYLPFLQRSIQQKNPLADH